jgi:16S rRNA (uracil1498-N3)-methyltransferase
MDRGGFARVMARRVPIADLASGERQLEGAVAHYLTRVLRLRPGDTFVAFDPKSAHEANATAIRAEGHSVIVRFEPLREGAARASCSLTWVQALAKGDKCDAIVRDATELGATRVAIVVTERSVVRLDSPRAKARLARWSKIAEEAARQSGRSDAPTVDPPAEWSHVVAGIEEGARFCLWQGAQEPLARPLFEALSRGEPLAFACGPEGGLTSGEVSFAENCGWTAVALGPLTLRTETVAAAVLGAVRVWTGLASLERAFDPTDRIETLR